MKILFVPSDNNFSSGAFRSMATLNKLLNEKFNIQTLIVLPNQTGDGVTLLDKYNLKYVFINSFNWIISDNRKLSVEETQRFYSGLNYNSIAIRELVKIIREENIDIIHINTTYSYVAAIAGKLTNTPVVWHLREFLEEDQKRRIFDREFGYKIISGADKIITISKALYKKYENVLPKDKMQIIHNGIDETDFYKPERTILSDKKVVFFCAGIINDNKGQFDLVEACGKLYEKSKKDFELILAGKCSEDSKNRVLSIAQRYGIENRIVLAGRSNDVNELFAKADIAFMCSKFEAFGRVSVEAMLSGCLLIGANTGGTLEIIDDGKTGLLYEQGNVNDLCEKIGYALENKEKMQKIASFGREKMHETMTAEINAKNIVEVYNQVIKKPKNLKVATVIVTYNRLNMLKDCLKAVLQQTYQSEIIIIDNASTDGTKEFFENLKNERIVYVNTGKNLGGAGGFNKGILEAYLRGANWIWVMDDDVIPQENALEELVKVAQNNNEDISFLASCVLSLDGQAMNTPGIDFSNENGYPFWFKKLDQSCVNIEAATFVSIMINAQAVMQCGLPYKDFFIWGDDTEYTKRIRKSFGPAYMVGKSKVVHARANSTNLTIYNEDNENRIFMFSYMVRNTLVYTRAYGGANAFRNKRKAYLRDCKNLRRSDDIYKKQKIKAIKKGLKDYDNFNFDKFNSRYNLFFEHPPIPKKPKTVRSVILFFPKKIRSALRIWKRYGFKAFLKRILYGKKEYGFRYKLGRAITWLPRKIFR